MCVYTQTHKRTNTQIDRYTHSRTDTCTNVHMHIQYFIITYNLILTFNLHKYFFYFISNYILTCLLLDFNMNTHRYTHIYGHTHIHARAHMNTFISMVFLD